MPELPEVETVMRGLDGRLTGRVITRATLHRPNLRWTIPPALPEILTGAQVLGFRRRGKYFFMRLNSGISMLVHLGMSGRMVIDAPFALHQHLTLETSDGGRVGFVDPRRFGALDLIATAEEENHKLIAGMGPEPLGNQFSPPALLEALAGKSSPIKSALLDQRIVAGIGNIYASEALYRAKISPRRRAGRLGPARIDRPGPGDQGHADRGHCRRRFLTARLCAAQRRAWLFPACLEGLRPGRPALRALPRRARLCRHPPAGTDRPGLVLLPPYPTIGWHSQPSLDGACVRV